MNTKQLTGIIVFILVFGVVGNSLVNHAFADYVKFNVDTTNKYNTKLLQQNIVSDKPEGKSDKIDTIKNSTTKLNPLDDDGTNCYSRKPNRRKGTIYRILHL